MKLRVLFIGNSHTYLNYMPQMIAALADAKDRGFELVADQCTGEGVSLEWHWKNQSSRDAIKANRWDCVVLQDRSGGPLEEPESFERAAALLGAEIRNQVARIIFYLTWADRLRPETQATLTEAYARMAQNLGATLAPVGLAWEAIHRSDPDFDLYHRDGRHANPIGSYLTACVFYSVLFNYSPIGLPGTFYYKSKKRVNLKKDRALWLQKVAWETVTSIGDFGFENSD